MNRSVFERSVKSYCYELAARVNFYSHRSRHACVLTYGDSIISSGVNVNLKNDFVKQFNELKGIHAESLALMRALCRGRRVLSHCELWVCRRNTFSFYSRPCVMCMRMIRSFKIPVIHYTDQHGNWVEEVVEYD